MRNGIRESHFTQILHCCFHFSLSTVLDAKKNWRREFKGKLAGFATYYEQKVLDHISRTKLLTNPDSHEKRDSGIPNHANFTLMLSRFPIYNFRWYREPRILVGSENKIVRKMWPWLMLISSFCFSNSNGFGIFHGDNFKEASTRRNT